MNNASKTLDVPPKKWYALIMNRKDWYELYTRRCLGVMDTQCPHNCAMYVPLGISIVDVAVPFTVKEM